MKVLKNDSNQRFIDGYTIEMGLEYTGSELYGGGYCNYALFGPRQQRL